MLAGKKDRSGKEISRRDFCKLVGVGTAGLLAASSGLYNIAAQEERKIPYNIPRRPIGNTGMEASILAIGAGSRFWDKNHLDEDAWEPYLERALTKEGINYIDTAINYGRELSERRLGQVIPYFRDELVISTKTPERTYNGVMRDVERSLRNLKTDYLDIYLMHNLGGYGDKTIKDVEDGYKALQKLKSEGTVKAIGFSSHGSRKLITDAVNQLDLDTVLISTNDPGYANFKPDIPWITSQGVAVSVIKVMRSLEIRGLHQPGSGARELYRQVLELPISTAVITHRTMDVFEENLATAREFGS